MSIGSGRVCLLTGFRTVKGIELPAGSWHQVKEKGETFVAVWVWQTGEIVDFALSEVSSC